jgi:NAD(P)-dependent dehydrogenase (short-subunit alcohol dehydrogenase family)
MHVLENAAKEHSPQSSNNTLNGQIIPIGPCDVTSKSDLESLVKELEAKEKYLTLFVAAAGVPGPKGHPDTSDATQLKANLWSEKVEEWNTTYQSDVTSVFFSTVAVLPLLQAAPSTQFPSVIVISSMSGLMRDSQAHFSYNAAKAATAHLTRMMSKEFAKTGVRVNSIAPGYFPSEMTMKESDERNKAEMPDDKVKDKGHEVPAGRAGRDEEMAMGILFLGRCGYVNGEVVKLDGGVLNEVGGG